MQILYLDSIPSPEGYGAHLIRNAFAHISLDPIPSPEGYGTHLIKTAVGTAINLDSIPSPEGYGAHLIGTAQLAYILLDSIPSPEGYGSHLVKKQVVTLLALDSIPSPEGYGTHRIFTTKDEIKSRLKVRWFDNTMDGKLVIGCGSAILKYPNLTTGRIFEDMVATDGSSAGIPVMTRLLINLASLHNVVVPPVAFEILLRLSGKSTTGGAAMKVAIYLNETASFKVYRTPVDEGKATLRTPKVGRLEQFLLEFTLDSLSALDVEDLILKEMQVGYVPRARIGPK